MCIEDRITVLERQMAVITESFKDALRDIGSAAADKTDIATLQVGLDGLQVQIDHISSDLQAVSNRPQG